MSEFSQRFLREPSGGTPALFLAAFGKHPGWNDHLDDFGLETESLILAKRQIYTQGLAGRIDSGAWDQLAGDKRLSGFNHLLLWVRRGNLVAGSMWSSQDGKGRAKYPMILCVQGVGVPADWTIDKVYPALDELKKACLATNSAEDVIKTLTEGRERLRQAFAHREPPPPQTPLARELTADRTGLHRVLYEIASQMRPMAPGSTDSRTSPEPASRRLRVPASPANARALAAWMRLISSQLDPDVPLLGIAARDQSWVDFLIGQPTPEDFFCIRASATQVPLTTEIPYTLEPAFVAAADQIVDDLVADRDSGRTIFGERPRNSFTLFPWASPTKGSSPPVAPKSSSTSASPQVKSHTAPFWLKALFILLGLAIATLTIYFAARRD